MAKITMTAADHKAAQDQNQTFLSYAVTKPTPTVLGTIASGSSGGPQSPVVWAKVIPVSPRWIDRISVYASIPYTITVPAGATCYVSALAPWCVLQQRLTIAGSPPWDQQSLVPFYLDNITRTRAWDPAIAGVPIRITGTNPTPNWVAYQDRGSWQFDMGNANLIPGASLTAGTYVGTMTFRGTIQLQRRRRMLFGTIPNGSPQDRPDFEMYLSPFVGPQPWNSLIQDPSASGATGATTGTATVIATYWSKGLDQLPAGVNPPLSSDITVGLGWQINGFNVSIQSAGAIQEIQHRTGMLYQKIFHLLYNNQQLLRADYFGDWITGEQSNNRWEFDASQNNFNPLFEQVEDRYHRTLPLGVYVADYVSGDLPDLPGETPYVAAQTPDQDYANSFGVAFMPAMETAIRIPSGTAMSNGGVYVLAMGYTEVPY